MIYIFDLDGTLADITHRLHHIKGNKKDYDSFFADCIEDAPIQPVIEVFRALQYDQRNLLYVFSGRSDAVKWETNHWLEVNRIYPHVLRMRVDGDYTPDNELKRKWLHEMTKEERSDIAMVFDDRRRLVDMWRSEGLLCCQVAEGNF